MLNKELQKAAASFAATGRAPLEGLYLAPGWKLPPDADRFSRTVRFDPLDLGQRGLLLLGGYQNINEIKGVREKYLPLSDRDLPVMMSPSGGHVLTGPAQYERYIEKPYYLLARADRHLTSHFSSIVHESFENAIVVELAIGDGKKTGEIFARCPRIKKPFRFVPHDLLLDHVRKAKQQACWGAKFFGNGDKPNYPLKHSQHVAGDFNEDATWKEICAVISPYQDAHPITLLSQGATIFNNPTPGQLPRLLQHFGRLPVGTNFLLSVDSTMDKEALRNEYDQPAFHHLCLTSFTHILWEMGRPFDPRTVTACRVEIDDSVEGCVSLTEVIETSDPKFPILKQDNIRKVAFDLVRRDLAEHGIDVHMRLVAGGLEFSKIDHAFAVAKRKNSSMSKQYFAIVSKPLALAG